MHTIIKTNRTLIHTFISKIIRFFTQTNVVNHKVEIPCMVSASGVQGIDTSYVIAVEVVRACALVVGVHNGLRHVGVLEAQGVAELMHSYPLQVEACGVC